MSKKNNPSEEGLSKREELTAEEFIKLRDRAEVIFSNSSIVKHFTPPFKMDYIKI